MIKTDTLQQNMPNGPTAVALGFFDGVHLGHRQVLSAAVHAKADGLIPCAFTFSVQRGMPHSKEGQGLILSEERKMTLLNELGMEYMICPDFSEIREYSAEDFVVQVLAGQLRAKRICCGNDFRFGRGATGSLTLLSLLCPQLEIELQIIPPVTVGGITVSSTRIREFIMHGNMEQAAILLGRPYCCDFPVAHGRQLGRTLGFPTINQPYPQGYVIPKFGVYAARVTVEGKVYSGVTNVGVKPTVGSSGPLAETYIEGYSGDVYGQRVQVELLQFLRPEQKFENVQQLRQQIARDALSAKQIVVDLAGEETYV